MRSHVFELREKNVTNDKKRGKVLCKVHE